MCRVGGTGAAQAKLVMKESRIGITCTSARRIDEVVIGVDSVTRSETMGHGSGLGAGNPGHLPLRRWLLESVVVVFGESEGI